EERCSQQHECKIGVIPAKAGFSTAELVIHVDLGFQSRQKKWIPAFAGMTTCWRLVMDSRSRRYDDFVGGSSRRLPEGLKKGSSVHAAALNTSGGERNR
ncbi:MAG TPA: hypothetical protein VFL07_15800, partial [Rudaea sp.]|nr:hypothetical protein [Rudaea sp.]